MMTSKYAHYLASKMYHHAPLPQQKEYIRKQIQNQMQKLIVHQFACEVIEYVYCQCEEKERAEMVISLYGNYFLLLKDFIAEQSKAKKNLSLAVFLEQKPNLREGIVEKLDGVIQKLVEKGLSRHSIVQAIILDYVNC